VCFVVYVYVWRRIVGRRIILDVLVRGGGVDEVVSVSVLARAHVLEVDVVVVREVIDSSDDVREEAAFDDVVIRRRPGIVGETFLVGDMHVIGHVLQEAVDVEVDIPGQLDLTIKRLESRGEADVGEVVGDVGGRDPELVPVDLILDGD